MDALPAVNLGTGRWAKALVCGAGSTCAILDDDTLKCWGANAAFTGPGSNLDRGIYPEQMGDGLPPIDLGTGRTVKHVSAGLDHWCAILDDDSVKCWGSDYESATGTGDFVDRTVMGDARPRVRLGTGRTARRVSAGFAFSCAILDDGSVKCWGSNTSGQLGIGSGVHSLGWKSDQMGDALAKVSLGAGRTAREIATGVAHACVILDDDTVKCWGGNEQGQLGLGDVRSRGQASVDMGDALPVVDLGTGRRAIALAMSASASHTCVVLDDHTLKCFGWNAEGQLGLEDTNARGGSPDTAGDALDTVPLGAGFLVDVAGVGNGHTCALGLALLKCWGRNDFGQLGLEHTIAIGGAPGSMGAMLPPVNVSF